jgi:hypothetical protein
MICADVPEQFWRALAARQDAVYQEAKDRAFETDSWTKPEAETVAPIIRRALFENELRKAAEVAGLRSFDMDHVGKNYGYVLIRAGNLVITAHHVGGPKHFVRPCESRKQNASINRWLDTLILDGILDLPSLDDAETINAYVLHGIEIEERAEQIFETPFLQVAVPDAELSRYQKNYAIGELIGAYTMARSGSAPSGVPITLIPDKAKPSINLDKIRRQATKESERSS